MVNGAFFKAQFHKHFKLGGNIETHDIVHSSTAGTSPRQHVPAFFSYDEEQEHNDAGLSGTADGSLQQTEWFLSQASQAAVPMTQIPPSTQESEGLLQYPKKKRISSITKYNTLLAEGKHLANIGSTDSDEKYNKLVAVLRHIRANYQNETTTVLKEASNNYLEVATPTGNE